MTEEKIRKYEQKMEDGEFQVLKLLNTNRQNIELEVGRQARRLHAMNAQADQLEQQRQGFLKGIGNKYGLPEGARWQVTNEGILQADIPEGMEMPEPPKKPALEVVENAAPSVVEDAAPETKGADEPEPEAPESTDAKEADGEGVQE